MALLINGERIDDRSLQSEAMRLRRVMPRPSQELAAKSEAEIAELARQNVIGRTLIRQEALRKKVKLSPSRIDAAMSSVMARFGGQEAFMQARGLTEKDLPAIRAEMEQDLRIDMYLNKVCPPPPVPQEDQARDYYRDHLNEFVSPDQIRVSHIVRQPGQGRQAETVYDDMVGLRAELKAGADFAELATARSECNHEPGGDLGFIAKGQMVEAFEAVVFSMDVGEVSPVFQTQFGLHIAKVTERRASRQMPFEDVKEHILEGLRQNLRKELVDRHVEQLKATATITEEAAPPAAS